jgi:hypothetical protein
MEEAGLGVENLPFLTVVRSIVRHERRHAQACCPFEVAHEANTLFKKFALWPCSTKTATKSL